MKSEYNMSNLIQDAAEISGIPAEFITSKSRTRDIVEVRQVCITVAKELSLANSLTRIGEAFHVDHATVIHSVKTVTNLKPTQSRIRILYHSLKSRVSHRLLEELNNSIAPSWMNNIPQY